jgi:hypothetical protein
VGRGGNKRGRVDIEITMFLNRAPRAVPVNKAWANEPPREI